MLWGGQGPRQGAWEDRAESSPKVQQHVHSPSSKERHGMGPDYLSWMTPVVFKHGNGGLSSVWLQRLTPATLIYYH